MNPGLPVVIRLGVLLASANAVLAQTRLPPAAASTNAGSAAPTGKPATGEYWLKEAQRTNATQAVYGQATQASDTEVAAAAE